MVDIYKNMENPFLPMLITNWIFGIGIVEYPINKPRKFISIIYTLIILITYGYLAYMVYPYIFSTWLSRSRPSTTAIFYFGNIAVTVSVIISGWFQSKGIRTCISKAVLANNLMQKIGIPKDHSKILAKEFLTFGAFLIFIITVITVNSILTFQRHSAEDGQIIAIFIQNYPIVIMFVADTSFMNILSYARYKIDKLNNMLESLKSSTMEIPLHAKLARQIFYENSHPQSKDSQTSKDFSFVIKTAKMAHLQLTKLCREANRTYGIHIIISIFFAFVIIIDDIFNIYLCLTGYVKDEVKIREIVRNVNWLMYFFVKTYTSSRLCSIVNDSAVKSGDIVSEIYDEPSLNEETKAEIRRFNVEMIQNKLNFSAYGIIRIDLTLVQSMVSTIATYLIIILQFQKVQYDAFPDD